MDNIRHVETDELQPNFLFIAMFTQSFAESSLDRVQFLYVGADVHKDSHTAVIADCFGRQLGEITIGNADEDFASLIASVNDQARSLNLTPVFGLEDTTRYGARLARYLFNSGFVVKTVSPVLVDHARKRETHPEKNDFLDAFQVARVLIQRIDRLPSYTVAENEKVLKNIKELSIDREFLVKERARIKNQLHRLLHEAYNTGYKDKFKDPFSVKALKYWHAHPVPKDEPSLILKNQIKRKVHRLMDIREETKEIEGELEQLLTQSGQQIETLNGCGVPLAASLIAEIKDIDRFQSPNALAKYAGLAPRERSSGKTFRHMKSKSGNRRLNMTIHRIALSQISRSGNQYARAYFQKKITEGKSKSQALCCLKRRLIDIVYMMLKHRKPYEYFPKNMS